MTKEEFTDRLNSDSKILSFKNETFDFSFGRFSGFPEKLQLLQFECCTFQGNGLFHFNYSDNVSRNGTILKLELLDCEINKSVIVSSFNITDLIIKNPSGVGSITLENNVIRNISIKGNNAINSLNYSLTLERTKKVLLENIQSKKQLLIKSSNVDGIVINNCNFKSVNILTSKTNVLQTSGLIVGDLTISGKDIKSLILRLDSIENSIFLNNLKNCGFFKLLIVNHCKPNLDIENSDFSKYISINDNKFRYITFSTVKFNGEVNLQSIKCDTFKLDNVFFEQDPFLENFRVLDPIKMGRGHLVKLKRLMQRSDNKIDYDRIRAQELLVHKHEIKKTTKLHPVWKHLGWVSRDYFILGVSSFFSNNGTDWIKAIIKTLFFAITFYIILYTIENYENTFAVTNLNVLNDFFMGFFKLLTTPKFVNPLSKTDGSFTSSLSFFVLILAKITIGIGVYETITSFRKFKK